MSELWQVNVTSLNGVMMGSMFYFTEERAEKVAAMVTDTWAGHQPLSDDMNIKPITMRDDFGLVCVIRSDLTVTVSYFDIASLVGREIAVAEAREKATPKGKKQ